MHRDTNNMFLLQNQTSLRKRQFKEESAWASRLEFSGDEESFEFVLPPRLPQDTRMPHSLESTIDDDDIDEEWVEAFCNVIEELHRSSLEEGAMEQEEEEDDKEEFLPPPRPRTPHPIYDSPDWIKEA